MKTLQTIKIDIVNSTRELTYQEFNVMVLDNAGVPIYGHHSENSLYLISLLDDFVGLNTAVKVYMAGSLSYGLVLDKPVYAG